MQGTLKQAPKFVDRTVVIITQTEKPNLVDFRRILRIHPLKQFHIQTSLHAVDEGALKFPFVHQVYGLRWSIEVIRVPLVEVVGRDNFANED